MFFLILTLCATPDMADCETKSVQKLANLKQCEVMSEIYSQILGDGPNRNYRLECIFDPDA